MIMNTVVGYILLMTLVLSLSIGVFYGLRAIKLV